MWDLSLKILGFLFILALLNISSALIKISIRKIEIITQPLAEICVCLILTGVSFIIFYYFAPLYFEKIIYL